MNTGRKEVGDLGRQLAKWFWGRQAAIVNHNVTFEERVKQKQQILEKTGLDVVVRNKVQDKRKEDRKRRKQREENNVRGSRRRTRRRRINKCSYNSMRWNKKYTNSPIQLIQQSATANPPVRPANQPSSRLPCLHCLDQCSMSQLRLES